MQSSVHSEDNVALIVPQLVQQPLFTGEPNVIGNVEDFPHAQSYQPAQNPLVELPLNANRTPNPFFKTDNMKLGRSQRQRNAGMSVASGKTIQANSAMIHEGVRRLNLGRENELMAMME